MFITIVMIVKKMNIYFNKPLKKREIQSQRLVIHTY
jgi:hypothetical protein